MCTWPVFNMNNSLILKWGLLEFYFPPCYFICHMFFLIAVLSLYSILGAVTLYWLWHDAFMDYRLAFQHTCDDYLIINFFSFMHLVVGWHVVSVHWFMTHLGTVDFLISRDFLSQFASCSHLHVIICTPTNHTIKCHVWSGDNVSA